MKKIKFRGLAIADFTDKKIEPHYVVGNLSKNEDGTRASINTFKDKTGMVRHFIVDPETVAQFVFEEDGVEYYEGDVYKDSDGLYWEAILHPAKRRSIYREKE